MLGDVGFYQNKRQFRFVPGILRNHGGSPGAVKINTASILDLQFAIRDRTTEKATSFPWLQIVLFLFVILVGALVCVCVHVDTHRERKSGGEPVSVCGAGKTLCPCLSHPPALPLLLEVLLQLLTAGAVQLLTYQISALLLWEQVTSAQGRDNIPFMPSPSLASRASPCCSRTVCKN